jgi:hypothetical protein
MDQGAELRMSDGDHNGCGMILPMVLEMTRTGIAYFSPEGNLIFCLGDTLTEVDFQIPNKVIGLLNRRGTPIKIRRVENGRSFLITYGLVKDRTGNTQGVLLTKQDTGNEAADEGRQDRGEKPEHPAAPSERRILLPAEHPAKITREQYLSELFAKYPGFRSDFFTLDEQLRGLNDPLALEMIQQATVGELAKSLRLDPEELAEKIQRMLDAY